MVEMETLFPTTLMFVIFCGLLLVSTVTGDLPCSPRQGDPGQGQICVCNSTYCDTIERPYKLPAGHYHLYSTSNSTPGFSHTTGTFSDLPTSGDEDVIFTINNGIKYQEIIGFGGSFSDSAGIVINDLPSAAQNNLLESYFGPKGLEYTFCRIPIGGTDFSPREYSYDDIPFDKSLEYFNLTQEDYNYKIPYIKKAIEYSARGIMLYGCTWNAPQWMKTSEQDSSNLSGYVRWEYMKPWAEYHVNFLKAYKDNGIDIWGLGGGNEVLFGFMMGSLNNTIALSHMQRVWMKDYLKPMLRAAGFSNVKFLAMDDMRIYGPYWMDRFKDDPDAYKEVDALALHWYLDYFVPPIFLDIVHRKHPEKLILSTESSINIVFVNPGENFVELGSWKRAALYIYNIMENINHWTNGYIDWNLALDTTGGPSLSMLIDAAIIVNRTSGEFYKQPIFYGIGHFSKFIPPGSRRVQVITSNSSSKVEPEESYSPPTRFSLPDNFPKYHSGKFREEGDDVGEGSGGGGNWGGTTAPAVVTCLASANSDDSFTIIVLNNKNVTSRVRLEVPELGSVTVNIEATSIYSFVYWT